MDLLIIWFLCLSAANGVWIVVFKSPLVKHLLSLRVDELYTSKDVENFFLARDMWFLHNLWVCATCQAVWTAALAALMVTIGAALSIVWLPFVFLVTLPFTKWTQNHL